MAVLTFLSVENDSGTKWWFWNVCLEKTSFIIRSLQHFTTGRSMTRSSALPFKVLLMLGLLIEAFEELLRIFLKDAQHQKMKLKQKRTYKHLKKTLQIL